MAIRKKAGGGGERANKNAETSVGDRKFGRRLSSFLLATFFFPRVPASVDSREGSLKGERTGQDWELLGCVSVCPFSCFKKHLEIGGLSSAFGLPQVFSSLAVFQPAHVWYFHWSTRWEFMTTASMLLKVCSLRPLRARVIRSTFCSGNSGEPRIWGWEL